jgi:hypothetical protein
LLSPVEQQPVVCSSAMILKPFSLRVGSSLAEQRIHRKGREDRQRRKQDVIEPAYDCRKPDGRQQDDEDWRKAAQRCDHSPHQPDSQ